MLPEGVERFIRSPREEHFEEAALEAFAFQFSRVEPIRRFCERRGSVPASVASWTEIPAVPASIFKSVDLFAAPPQAVFESSGTTQGDRRSAHHHPFLELYRTVIDSSFPTFCLPRGDRPPMLSLIPKAELAPESSLSFMVEHVLDTFGAEASVNAVGPRGIEPATLRSWLGARQRAGTPCFILATALSLHQCLDGLDRLGLSFRLPPGSAIFETGGFKTRTQELDRAHLHDRVEQRLGLSVANVVEEYGMTELTSQAYTRTLLGGAEGLFVCPPWMKARILDPATLDEVSEGGDGLLALFDLANIGSALHLLTEDIARKEEGGFRLTGRATGAELRGCSLTAEDLAQGPLRQAP